LCRISERITTRKSLGFSTHWFDLGPPLICRDGFHSQPRKRNNNGEDFMPAATMQRRGRPQGRATKSTDSQRKKLHDHGIPIEQSVIINRSADDLYGYWRNFTNLPHFMESVESVQRQGDGRSHWIVKGPAGKSVEWDAEIINDEPGRLIAWRSLPDADVDHAGTVRFEPATGGRGTRIHVSIKYAPPAGKLGVAVAKLFGEDPKKQVREDLRRFKALMETGEIPTTEGQSRGAGHKSKGERP
jgi:uncharacterized membrane protein